MHSYIAENFVMPSNVYIRQSTRPSLVHILACRLFGDNTLSESMLDYSYLDPAEQLSMKFRSQVRHFHSRKCV